MARRPPHWAWLAFCEVLRTEPISAAMAEARLQLMFPFLDMREIVASEGMTYAGSDLQSSGDGQGEPQTDPNDINAMIRAHGRTGPASATVTVSQSDIMALGGRGKLGTPDSTEPDAFRALFDQDAQRRSG